MIYNKSYLLKTSAAKYTTTIYYLEVYFYLIASVTPILNNIKD